MICASLCWRRNDWEETDMGRQPRVFTVGVFDYFHYGHLRLFNQIRELRPGCCLIVAVHDGNCVKKYKPDAQLFYSTEVRCDLVRSLRQVDQVLVYEAVDDIVRKVDFDIFAVGEDQNHAGFQNAIAYCRNAGREVLHLRRTPDISSSLIKQNLEFRKK